MAETSEEPTPAPREEAPRLSKPWRTSSQSESPGRVHVSLATSGKRLRNVVRHLHGHLLFLYLGFRYRNLVSVARPLAVYLERQLFPMLSESGHPTLDLCVEEDAGRACLVGRRENEEFQLPGTESLATALENAGIAVFRLDTRLEYGQIVEALLTLMHARPHLADAPPCKDDYLGWNAKRVASAMRGKLGYHKFCAEMRYDPESRIYYVAYSYCELFFSRAIRNYVERRSWYHDHRAMFYLAPRLAIAAGLLLLLPGIALDHASPWALALWVLFSLLTAAGLGLSLHAIGALLYAQEHRDVLIDDYCRQIGRLSRFPETNPNVVVKLDREGQPLYLNPAARRLLMEVCDEQQDVARILPRELGYLLAACFDKPEQAFETETELHGRVLRYVLSPFADERSVIAVGSDVTYLKAIERELRDLNENLERLVEERTAELRETQDVTILSLGALAEIRDPETGKHLQRTRAYVKALAEKLREHPRFRDVLDDHVIDHLHKSVPLHDVGKIGMPDAILLKPEKLTDEEYERMKQHTTLGGDALRWAEEKLGFDSFLRVARDIAYYHHEHWDGSGYPHGLKGDDIPWAARLMTLADFYDALTTERVYKEAFPHEHVREDIVRERGKKFDPDVVDAFLAIEDEFIRISKDLSE